MKAYRLAVLQSHPIQYFAPLFRRLAQEAEIELTVFFCSRQGVESYTDEGFGRQVQWDIPLLEGYNHKFLPNLNRDNSVGGFTSLVNPSIVTELARGNYDALLVHGHAYATNIIAILAAKVLGVPVLMRGETHLLLQRSPLKRLLRRPVMSFFYRKLCRVCLPIGTLNHEFYRYHNVGSYRLFLVPYSVDNDYFINTSRHWAALKSQVRAELGLPRDKSLVLYASKLSARKRPMDLLLAYEKLRANGTEAALAFVGSGEEEEALSSYVEQHRVPDVYFFGFRNQSELPKFYGIADVFVLPSENEPWGLVINEVMCAGIPVVATSEIGAVRDLVQHGQNGFIYQSADIEALTAHISTLIGDAELRKKMGEQSLLLMNNWNFERCVQGFNLAMRSLRKDRRANTL